MAHKQHGSTCGQRLSYPSWRAELLDRAPAIVAAGGVGAEWWREEFGREPLPILRVIKGGAA